MPPVLTYNSVAFPNSETKVKVSSQPIPDEQKRTVKYIEHTLDVESYITPADTGNSTTKATMETYRQALQVFGANLTFTGWGFGDLIIGGAVKDVDYGPKPKILEWEPRGPDKSCKVRWQCVVAMPECVGARFRRGVVQLSYTVTWSYDERGICTRTIDGFLEIAQGRAGNYPDDEPDNYRDQVRVPKLLGFKRTQVYRRESSSRLGFTVVDAEIDSVNPYPRGVSNADVRHNVRSSGAGLAKWSGVVSGNITVARNFSPQSAFSAIIPTIRDRINQANTGATPGSLVLLSVDLQDEIFGKGGLDFSIQYTFASTLADIFAQSGLFRPVPGASWSDWQQSMEESHSNRARSKLKHSASNDKIIDLCGGSSGGGGNVSTLSAGGGSAAQQGSGLFAAFGTSVPSAAGSWLSFRNRLVVKTQSGNIVHSPALRTNPANASLQSLSPSDLQALSTRARGGKVINAPVVPNKIQRSNGGRATVTMTGVGLRAGYNVPIPELNGIGDAKAHEISRNVVPDEQVANYNMPVFRSVWKIEYALDKSPSTNIPVFANPIYGAGTTVG